MDAGGEVLKTPLAQILAERKSRNPSYVFLINKRLWETMDNLNRAGLVLHEVIYEEAADLNLHENSRFVRYFNEFLSSVKFEALSPSQYELVMEKSRLANSEKRFATVSDIYYFPGVKLSSKKASQHCHLNWGKQVYVTGHSDWLDILGKTELGKSFTEGTLILARDFDDFNGLMRVLGPSEDRKFEFMQPHVESADPYYFVCGG